MRSNKTVALVCGAAIGGGSLLSVALAQLGPLDPPNGPVTNTGPSLSDLAANEPLPQTFAFPAVGNFSDRAQGVLVESGRLIVECISVSGGRLTIFDGPGSVDNFGSPTSGTVVARVSSTWGSQTNASQNTDVLELGVLVNNGLYAAWDANYSTGHVTIVYRNP